MATVTIVLLQTIKELQSLPSLQQFALAGGTNLAFRFNHRESQDVDLFCTEIVSFKHFEAIETEMIFFSVKKIYLFLKMVNLGLLLKLVGD